MSCRVLSDKGEVTEDSSYKKKGSSWDNPLEEGVYLLTNNFEHAQMAGDLSQGVDN